MFTIPLGFIFDTQQDSTSVPTISSITYNSVFHNINGWGIVFNPDYSKFYINDEDKLNILEYNSSNGSLINTLDVNTNNNIDYRSLAFNSDGSKLFVLSAETNCVMKVFNLSTNYSLSNVTSTSEYTIGAIGRSRGFCFNNTGTKLFITDVDNDTYIYYITLSSAYDLTNVTTNSNWSYVNYKNDSTASNSNGNTWGPNSSNITDIHCIQFSNNGKKLYLLPTETSSNKGIWQFVLTTSYDLTSDITSVNYKATVDGNGTDINGSQSDNTGIWIDNNITAGSKVYVITKNDGIHEFEFPAGNYSTTMSISNATYTGNSKRLEPNSGKNGSAVYISNDGTKLYYLIQSGSNIKNIYQHTLSTAFDLSTMGSSYVSQGLTVYHNDSLAFNSSGTEFYIGRRLNSSSKYEILKYTLNSGSWDISNGITKQSGTINVQTYFKNSFGMDYAETGGTKYLYITSYTTDEILQYDITTWAPSTPIATTSTLNTLFPSIAPTVSGVDTDIKMTEDGTRIFLCYGKVSTIYEIDLSTAYDLTTMSYNNVSFYLGADYRPTGITFDRTNGSRMYAVVTKNNPGHM